MVDVMAKKKTTKRAAQNSGRTADGQFGPGNSHRFQKGVSGNPGGRPRRSRLSEAIIEKLAEVFPAESETTIADFIAGALVKEALKGNVQAAKELADRSEGRAPQKLDIALTGAAGRMADELLEAIHEAKLSEAQANQLLEIVERRWSAIQIDSRRDAS
jgi:uncharacterized protein DUF5681